MIGILNNLFEAMRVYMNSIFKINVLMFPNNLWMFVVLFFIIVILVMGTLFVEWHILQPIEACRQQKKQRKATRIAVKNIQSIVNVEQDTIKESE